MFSLGVLLLGGPYPLLRWWHMVILSVSITGRFLNLSVYETDVLVCFLFFLKDCLRFLLHWLSKRALERFPNCCLCLLWQQSNKATSVWGKKKKSTHKVVAVVYFFLILCFNCSCSQSLNGNKAYLCNPRWNFSKKPSAPHHFFFPVIFIMDAWATWKCLREQWWFLSYSLRTTEPNGIWCRTNCLPLELCIKLSLLTLCINNVKTMLVSILGSCSPPTQHNIKITMI